MVLWQADMAPNLANINDTVANAIAALINAAFTSSSAGITWCIAWRVAAVFSRLFCLLFALALCCLAVAVRACMVSFAGERGVRHSVEVTAETLYEAAATALSIF